MEISTLRKMSTAICALAFAIMPSAAQNIDSLKPVQLSEVGIKWVKPSGEALFSATNINRADLEQNIGNGSVNNLFDLVPSMITTSDAGTGIGYTYMRMRGIDQTRINVTVNGIALNDAESQGSWFVNLPDFGARVENLEVQRGVGTSNNGSAAFGATMNFTTANISDKPFVEWNSAAGSFYTFRNAISAGTGLIGKRFAATASYSNIVSNGFIDRATAKMHALFISANYHLLNKRAEHWGTIRFNLLYGNEKTGLAWNGVPADSLATNRTFNPCGIYYNDAGEELFYENQTDNYQQTHYQLFYNLDKTRGRLRHRVDVGFHLTRGKGYYEEIQDDAPFAMYGLPDWTTPRDTFSFIDLVTQKAMDNYFYGMTFSYKQDIALPARGEGSATPRRLSWSLAGGVNRYDGKYFGAIAWMQYAGNLRPGTHWHDGSGDKWQANIFGTCSYSWHNLFTYIDLQYRFIDYTIGGTSEHLADIGQHYRWHFFNPKMGIQYNIGMHALYCSFAMANREPTRSDIIDAPTERKPTYETIYDIELGYRLKLRDKWAMNLNGYLMYYDNQLVLTGELNSVGAAMMTNVKRSYRLGIELISAYQPVRFFAWKLNGTLSTNKILNFTDFVDDWDTGMQRQHFIGTTNISFSPTFVGSNELIFTPLRHFNINFITKFVSRQYIDNSSDNAAVIKPYCVNNLQISYAFHPKFMSEIGLFLHVNNLFNARYESNAWLYKYWENNEQKRDCGYFPQAGFNVIGGVTLRF